MEFQQLLWCSKADIDWSIIDQQVQADSHLQKIITKITQHGVSHIGFTMEHGRLLYKGCVVLPSLSSLIQNLLYEYHCSPMGGHNGEFKTYLRLADHWF